MTSATLHYIYDPLCGWCYAAEPLMTEAANIDELKVEMHGGGLFAGANKKTIGADMRNFILSHDARIAALSGQVFGDAYKNKLLTSGDVMLDSVPPTRAVLVAEQLEGMGLDMQLALQRAHYVSGQRIAEQATLQALAEQLGLNADAFRKACEAMSEATVMDHMRASRRLMESVGGMGFPTFVFEQNGSRVPISHQQYYGQPQAWKQHLLQRLSVSQ